MLLALSTVSVAAAQLFAPEDLKPSNLTGLTKKPEPKPQPTKEEEKPLNMNKEGEIKTEVDSKNMEAPLKWDNENDVILVDSCDLQMKFPKESVNQGMKSKNNSINKTDNGVVIEYNFEFGSGPTHSYFISCEDKILTLEQYEKENSNALTGDPNGLGRPTVIDISKQELCNQLGFIAASCDKISNTKKIIKPTAESNLVSYYFTGLDKTFIISSFVQFKDDTYPEFAAKYITKTAFQFNSLSNPKLQAQSTTPAPTKKLLSYTNPYFPDFKLVYPEDWKFETSTEPAFENLLNRRITLSKNSRTLSFVMSPVLPFGGEPIFVPDAKNCQPGTTQEKLIEEGTLKIDKLSNNVEKLTIETNCKDGWEDLNNKVFYGNLNVVSFQLKSNIKASNIKGYTYAPEDGLIRFNVSQLGNINENDPFVKEIDQIISQSSFK
jgi:hypothetical protein